MTSARIKVENAYFKIEVFAEAEAYEYPTGLLATAREQLTTLLNEHYEKIRCGGEGNGAGPIKPS